MNSCKMCIHMHRDHGEGCGGWGDTIRDDEDLELGQFGGGERLTVAAATDRQS